LVSFKNNWEETYQRFDAWFRGEKTGRPLMNLFVPRDGAAPCDAMAEIPFDDSADMYLNVEKNVARCINRCREYEPLAEAFPKIDMNLGAGSMALYLGSEPTFAPDTIWFSHFVEEYEQALPFTFNPDNVWWKKHLEMLHEQVRLTAGTDIMVCIPDIVENIDVLSAIRDPQQCCFDIYDYPDEMAQAVSQISDLYMQYYDPIYDIVKKPGGQSAYTAFDIVATGKTAKIQCDFGALIQPSVFDEYVIPGLQRQCSEMDNLLFHLDGPECIVHVDSLMKLDGLGALQWTPGERNELGGSERWFDLYKKVRCAGKGLWIALDAYEPSQAIEAADRIVREIGAGGLYFQFPVMSRDMAESLMIKAEKEWKI